MTLLYNYFIDSQNLRNFIIDIDLENIYSTSNIYFNNVYSNQLTKNAFFSNYFIKTQYDLVK